MEFLPLGYGEYDSIVKKLTPGKWVLISDEDAATVGMDDCWFAAQGDLDKVQFAYEADGGTVSTIHSVYVEYEADDVYESFQNPEKCRELIGMLCNSGLLPEILKQCAEFAEDGVS